MKVKNPMKVLLIGYSASGKSTIAREISKQYNTKRISVSALIDKYITEMKEKKSYKSLKNNTKMYQFISDNLPNDFVLDGVREYNLYRFLKRKHKFNTYIVVLGELDRIDRLRKRNMSWDDIISLDLTERQIGISYLLWRIRGPMLSGKDLDKSMKDFKTLEGLE